MTRPTSPGRHSPGAGSEAPLGDGRPLVDEDDAPVQPVRDRGVDERELRVLVDPPVTEDLTAAMSDVWVRVTNAGGAVGYVPPVGPAEILPATQRVLARVRTGTDTLVTLFAGDELVAWCVLEQGPSGLRRHWRTVVRVQVDPARQGNGFGDRLMAAANEVARDMGLAALCLSVRGGIGVERFYQRHGYEVVGRLPRAIRVAPDDERTEVIMWCEL